MSGLHGKWLEIAVAIDGGAQTHRQLLDAMFDGQHSASWTRRGITFGLTEMKKHEIIDKTVYGYFYLTEKGLERMREGMADA